MEKIEQLYDDSFKREIIKHGSSLSFTIPREYVKVHDLKEGEMLQVWISRVQVKKEE